MIFYKPWMNAKSKITIVIRMTACNDTIPVIFASGRDNNPVVELDGELTLSKSKCMCELSITSFMI